MLQVLTKDKFPRHIDIELTNHCQFDCVMCPHSQMSRSLGYMSFDTVKKIADEAKGKTITAYLHLHGEPLLHPDVIRIIERVKKANIWTSLSTNCLMLSEEMSIRLFEAGLDEIVLALDSLDEKTYKTIRQNSNYQLVLGNVLRCIIARKENKWAKTKLHVQIIDMKETANEIERFKGVFTPLLEGIGYVGVKGYTTYAGSVPNKAPNYVPSWRGTCRMPNYSTTIYWNGDVVICCQDWDRFTKVGNIHENSIQEIWDNPQYERYRFLIKKKAYKQISLCARCQNI